MTAITMPVTAPVAARPRLITRPLLLVLLADFGGLTSFYLLLSVVPQYTTAAGVGGIGAGVATGTLMLSSVAAEFVMPRLVARFGHRTVLAAGLVLLGVPALALPWSASLPMVLTVCLLRGVGLAVIFVVCGALGAELIPAERRGEGLGVLGVVAGLPAVIATPLGVWLMGHAGYPLVFLAGAVTALAGLAAVVGLPSRTRQPQAHEPFGIVAGLRSPALTQPSVAFAGTAMAAGIVVTFLPGVVSHGSGNLAAVALLAQAVAATAARWWAGRYGDRHGPAKLLAPGVFAAAAGMLALVLAGSPLVVLVGMTVFGAGFGVVQNASLAMMYARVTNSGYGTVTALWSIAYDTGYGLGAAGFGVLAAQTGYPLGFAVTAVAMLAILATARRR